MRTRVQKWGNSLAVRIPRAFAEEVRLSRDAPVELSIVGGALVVAPVAEGAADLAALLAGVTEENRHGEVQTGGPVGDEAW